MGDFDIIIEGKRFHCTKAHIEFDDSMERSPVDCTELKRLAESWNIPRQKISATMCIDKKSPNYEKLCELFESLRRTTRFAEGE